MPIERKTRFVVLAFALVMAGCPIEGEPLPSLDYTGLIYKANEFWPLAEGNYWLWMDPDDPNDWYSKKVIKSRQIAGMTAYLVESRNHVDTGEVFGFEYVVDHPKGLYRTSSEDTLLEWAQTPDDVSQLIPLLPGEFVRGNLPYPAAYNPNQEYSVAELQDLAPFDRCASDDPAVVNGGPDDFLVYPDHTVLLTHTPGECPDATRERIAYGCYALDIGPLVWPGWRRGTLVRAVVDGYEFAL